MRKLAFAAGLVALCVFNGCKEEKHSQPSVSIVHGESAPVPEPATIITLTSGLLGLAGYGWTRRK